MVRGCLLLAGVVLLCLCVSPSADAFDFRVNDFYGTGVDSNVVIQYSPTGAMRDTLAVSLPQGSYGLRGIAFGPDHLLYVSVAQSQGFSVLALDSHGTVLETYTHSAYISGDVADGKICFDSSGHFYVGTGRGLVRFDQHAQSSGSLVYTSGGVQDVLALSNGSLLVATSYNVYEMTVQGQVLRSITPSDPSHLVTGTTPYFTDIMGIEYHPGSNSLFVTALGHSNFYNTVMKLNATSGVLLDYRTWPNANDMVVSSDGRLIVGNRTYNPRIYGMNLMVQGTLAGSPSSFITQCVPEPSSIIVLLCGLGSLVAYRRRR